jgi:hypothetical protein
MDESARMSNLRNRIVYAFSQSVSQPRKYRQTILSNDILNQVRAGAVVAETECAVCDSPPFNCIPGIQDSFFICLEASLTFAAGTNMGPTKCSRFYYLFMASVAQAYNWVQASNRITGTIDNWNWDVQHILTSQEYVYVWMNRTLIAIMNVMVPTFDPSILLADERSMVGLSVEAQTALEATVYSIANQPAWLAAWNAWWSTRAADGSVTASTLQPTVVQNANMTTVLDVAGTVDPATFPAPTLWTPLKIGGVTQRYATYTWANVASTALSAGDMTTIQGAATPFYPGNATTANNPTEPRSMEISTIVGYTATLTDEQKVNAEFWAGGPYTVSPPGMFIWMWKMLLTVQRPALDIFFFSGLDLAIHLFETGRVVWALKTQYMEARPIQEIRRLYRGQSLTGYDGTPVAGESWMPYQVPTFVTPPFADFSSGHSGFSQSFANVMNAWFGAAIPNTDPFLMTDLQLLSPTFLSPQSNPLGQFTFVSGTSEVQPLVVPAESITFRWTTWSDMALSAGLSRQYGGIHAISAHNGSVAAANALHPLLKSYWNLSPV